MPKSKLHDVTKFRVTVDLYLENDGAAPTEADAEKVVRNALAQAYENGIENTDIALNGYDNIEGEVW